jgi:hypothetical protein
VQRHASRLNIYLPMRLSTSDIVELPFVPLRGNRSLFPGLLIAAACGMCLTFFGSQAFGASPVGLWYAEGGAAEVQVFPCAGEFCGKVVWLRSPVG